MAFWGAEVKPGKPYTHRLDESGRLHLSQATLVAGSSTKRSVLQCNVGDKKPIYLCNLLPEKFETCPLNLDFEEDDEVTFSVIGPHGVHLSGFFYGESHNCSHESNEYGFDSGEDIVDTESGSDESTDCDMEEESEDDFIDDDLNMHPPSPLPNSGVRIEEILDDEKPANENGNSKHRKMKKSQLTGSSDDNSLKQIVVKGGSDEKVLESEDEDGFPIASTATIKADLQKTKSKAENKNKEAIEETNQKKLIDESVKSLKRKVEAALLGGGEQARETNQSIDPCPTSDMVPESERRQKKKNKKKRVNVMDKGADEVDDDSKTNMQPEVGKTGDINQASSVGKEKDEMPIKEDAKKRKKNKKDSKKQEASSDSKSEQKVTASDGSNMETLEKGEVKPLQVRTFPNGLVIEELKMGKPDGKRASPGKKVSVRYIGKLKKNEKIFDSNVGRAPFKFRLGVGEVIKGWDVGVNGMRIGDKRRLTIPPAMGYGAKGASGAIPPNSWLVFDVELVDVN